MTPSEQPNRPVGAAGSVSGFGPGDGSRSARGSGSASGVRPVSSANDAPTWGMFLLLSAIWGSSFLFIKVGLDEGVPPLTLVSLRTLFAGLLLGAVLLVRGGSLPRERDGWQRMAFLGMTNIVIPFALIAWGQQYIPTGMASILNAMVPLFTVLLAAVLLVDEHITPARLGGLALGFLGVVLLASPSVDLARTDEDAVLALAGMAAVALAAVFYAVAAVYARRRVIGQPIIAGRDGSKRPARPAEIALGSTLSAFLIISPAAVILERPADGLAAMPESVAAWFSMVWLGALGTGVAYLLFFRILERWGATRTTLVTYVIPVVAIALGFVVLGERLRLLELAGAMLIIGGVVLVNGNVGQRPLRLGRVAGTEPDPVE